MAVEGSLTGIPLVKALRLPLPGSSSLRSKVAFVGSGGKSSLMFRLAHLLPPPVWVSASTHLAADQTGEVDVHILLESPDEVEEVSRRAAPGVTLFTGPIQGDRTEGLSLETLQRLSDLADEAGAYLLIEADGSRRHPLKAPAAHEPPIPPFVDTVLVVVGLSGLWKPLTPEWVHRPEIFTALSGAQPGTEILPETLKAVLTHPAGGLKNIPAQARRVAYLNQVETPELQSAARDLAGKPYGITPGLLEHYKAVLVGGHDGVQAVYENSAGVILAAGESRRWRESGREELKQLLVIDGKPMVRQAAELAVSAGLSPVVVVLGAEREAVERALDGLPVRIVYNPSWREGMSTSLKAGVFSLPQETGSAIFLLADQPYLTSSVLKGLLELHAVTLTPLAAPRVRGQRKNPALLDRVTFDSLMSITGDEGARSLFLPSSPYQPAWLELDDDRPFLDIDTQTDLDYQR